MTVVKEYRRKNVFQRIQYCKNENCKKSEGLSLTGNREEGKFYFYGVHCSLCDSDFEIRLKKLSFGNQQIMKEI